LNDNWDSFRYFLAVARTGTLSAAAIQFRIERTTAARRIRMIEDELKSLLSAAERLLHFIVNIVANQRNQLHMLVTVASGKHMHDYGSGRST
jgi:Bacterial regulatory helix-turn-helix protein, lysR family